ncbi:hypothetical protein BMS3Abin07_02366 [bacterium BMS3Abin07]|nr:hypothetical protein BMS3Abin07_02366 [bacterium BMS3Abin07]GBE31391.1 hypothetical protein BMS3Bbin05_00291 [bacterium BMS3Bbin05]HDL21271.1 hypothetical protein [Nitrospirota bacterium]HDO21346.1 hypothetical protein [Nitrospirota bacterium]HDZ88085.1 hypothetical protein [Nitrospirota bacterium]
MAVNVNGNPDSGPVGLEVNFDRIQKAMEDVRRDSFDYYLDTITGKVISIPVNLFDDTLKHLYKEEIPDDDPYDNIEFDSELDTGAELPLDMLDELEVAISVIHETERYIRIPERDKSEAFGCMKVFAESRTGDKLKKSLLKALDGEKAFRRFKDVLIKYPEERKKWNRFNAKKIHNVIRRWLKTCKITAARKRK